MEGEWKVQYDKVVRELVLKVPKWGEDMVNACWVSFWEVWRLRHIRGIFWLWGDEFGYGRTIDGELEWQKGK